MNRYVASCTLLIASGSLSNGCAFADYEIGLCTPNPADQAADDCQRLNHAAASDCRPWQCDSASRRCVQRARDDDKDGDASAACGGGDCDDHDPQVSSQRAEVCDGKDNNCDHQIDEGVVGPESARKLMSLGALSAWADPWFGGTSGRDLLATWVTPSHCVQAMALNVGGGYLASDCAFGVGAALSPRQPQAAILGGGAGAVMVTTSGGCSAVRYAFGASGSEWTQSCAAAAPGASLPAVAAFAAARTVLVAWYAVDFSARENPVQSCDKARPADLRAVVLAGSDSVVHATSAPLVLVAGGASIRPPALLAVGESMLAAAPSADGIVVVSINSQGALGVPAAIGGAQGARAVVMAAAPDGVHLALAAEIGCTPQSIGVAFGSWDAVAHSARFDALIEAAPRSSGVSVQPSITWIEARGEWLVTWIADGPLARGRRFAANGLPVGAGFDIGPARQAAAALDGNVYALVDQPDTQVVQMTVGCHKGEQK